MKTWELHVSHQRKEKDFAQFKTGGVNCVISNLIQSNEKKDYEYFDIDTIINEIELLRCVNIIVKVIQIEDVWSSRNLMLQEYLVTDDGENTIPLTMFKDLTQVLKNNTTLKIWNVQVVTYKNKENIA